MNTNVLLSEIFMMYRPVLVCVTCRKVVPDQKDELWYSVQVSDTTKVEQWQDAGSKITTFPI